MKNLGGDEDRVGKLVNRNDEEEVVGLHDYVTGSYMSAADTYVLCLHQVRGILMAERTVLLSHSYTHAHARAQTGSKQNYF